VTPPERSPALGATTLRAAIPGALIVLAVALALRLSHLAALRDSFEGTHLFALARGDSAHHWYEALDILRGEIWLRDRMFWKGPGYSYFLAGLMQIVGSSPAALRWPLALLGAANCAGLVLVSRSALGPRWSTLAGLLAASNGVLLLFDGELFFPTLLVTLNLPALWLVTRTKAGLKAHAGAGCLLGLAALVHPVYVVPTAMLALWIALRSRRRALALALAAAATIAPLTLSNIFVRGQAVPISWNGGINLYVGNQPCFDQYSGNRTGAWARIMQTPLDAGIELEHDRDRLYLRLAAEQASHHPLQALGMLLRKTTILFSPVEYASNMGLYELREHSPVLAATLGRWGPLWMPFGLWGPLAILGLGLMLCRRAPLGGALGMWGLGLAITVVLSFNTARYRAPLVFFGCICVAYAVAQGWLAWSERRYRTLVAGVCVCLVLALLMGILAVPQRGLPLPLEWDEAAALSSEGALDRAEPWVERALERAPNDPQLKLAAADFFRRRGSAERERELLEDLSTRPDTEPDLISIAHHHLAKSYAAAGDIEAARREIESALALGVDATDWRGRPYYRLGLGPMNACWLRLEAAGFEFATGEPARGVALMERVRAECPPAGRIETRLAELEVRAVLSRPRVGID
jgi:tetratricopeptide (TPR) repeat protein